jgi:cyclopropane fatty-acyl-phospholipid synthase-like methyltransferase
LEIIVGNLNDIKFEKKYDYITLIGVLEYQNNFTESENPFKDFLAKIRNLLNPNGKIKWD